MDYSAAVRIYRMRIYRMFGNLSSQVPDLSHADLSHVRIYRMFRNLSEGMEAGWQKQTHACAGLAGWACCCWARTEPRSK
jgi:hypothetical protein